jgi:molybdate transport system ATP-binding protein
MGVADLLDQSVTTLSGGQRQRVALARALLAQPRLLCMDEPLSALDWRAKAELLALIDTLARETGIPVLYITHAPQEVERLADRVIFMQDGRIERIETLHEALARPDSPLFAEEGPVSVLQGRLSAPDADGLTAFGNASLRLRLSLPPTACPSATRLRVLARDVSLATLQPQGLSILNQLPITITALHPDAPGRVAVVCQLADGQTLLAEITRYSCQLLALTPGMAAFALIKSVALME